MIKTKKISNCRLCKSTRLKKIIDFGKIALGNNLQLSKLKSIKAEKYPLILNRCKDCNHFQLGHSVNPKILYATNYTYLSNIGTSFVSHFEKYSISMYRICKLNRDSKILDIGSNDGSCLKFFKDKGCKVLGIDPAKEPAKIAKTNGVNTIVDFFNSKSASKIFKNHGLFNFITSHNVLAHIDNIDDVFKNIFKLLKINGYFCFEVGYFHKVLKNNYFDTIYHEHLDYHHANPLVLYLNKIGFSVINITTNNVQGGSIRIMCQKRQNKINSKKVEKFLNKEKKSILYNKNFLSNWSYKVKSKMKRLKAIVDKNINKGSILVGYGAPTKATLLLKISKIRNTDISYVIEDNQLKISRYLPNSKIKIVGVETLSKIPPDTIIIFAWNFAKEIKKTLKRVIKKPIKVIIPLPNPIIKQL